MFRYPGLMVVERTLRSRILWGRDGTTENVVPCLMDGGINGLSGPLMCSQSPLNRRGFLGESLKTTETSFWGLYRQVYTS